jgi:hypothetical protein
MFGFGNRRQRRVRNDTFGSNKLRNAAIAGVGMLAWQWWRNRQSSGMGASRRFTETAGRSSTEGSTQGEPW